MIKPEPVPSVGSQVARYSFIREVARGPLGALFECRKEGSEGASDMLARVVELPLGLPSYDEKLFSDAAWDSAVTTHALSVRVADVVFGKGWFTLVHDSTDGILLSVLEEKAAAFNLTFPADVAVRIALDVLEGLELSREQCDAAQLSWRTGGVSAYSLSLCRDGRTRTLDGQVTAVALRLLAGRHDVTLGVVLPPDVSADPSSVSERLDVFMVGALLWGLLTGRKLDLVRDYQDGFADVSKAVPVRTSVSKGLVQTIGQALKLTHTQRQGSLRELTVALVMGTEKVASYPEVVDFVDALVLLESSRNSTQHVEPLTQTNAEETSATATSEVCAASTTEEPSATATSEVCAASTTEEPSATATSEVCAASTTEEPSATATSEVCAASTTEEPSTTATSEVCAASTTEEPSTTATSEVCAASTTEDPSATTTSEVCAASTTEDPSATTTSEVCAASTTEEPKPAMVEVSCPPARLSMISWADDLPRVDEQVAVATLSIDEGEKGSTIEPLPAVAIGDTSDTAAVDAPVLRDKQTTLPGTGNASVMDAESSSSVGASAAPLAAKRVQEVVDTVEKPVAEKNEARTTSSPELSSPESSSAVGFGKGNSKPLVTRAALTSSRPPKTDKPTEDTRSLRPPPSDAVKEVLQALEKKSPSKAAPSIESGRATPSTAPKPWQFQISVSTLVLGFSTTVLAVVVIMMLVMRSQSPSTATTEPKAQGDSVRAETKNQTR